MNSPSEDDHLFKLALLGLPGAGKSTFVELASEWAAEHTLATQTVVLANPLYEAQAAIYRICDVPLEEGTQDGQLLNFLGAHMRMINPDVLRHRFLARLSEIRLAASSRTLVICPDARPLDIAYLRLENFRTVLISVSPEKSMKRRIARGDLSLGATEHRTETGLDSRQVDVHIENEGSLTEYARSVRRLLDSVAA
jgi:dephospho-CoA kinase